MNHLAHCFLSFGDEDVLLGNFIGDFVKGNDWQAYPPGVQTGLLLHRAIDACIDTHPQLSITKSRIRAFGGRYSGPYCDILFDHLLTIRWAEYSQLPLADFCSTTYAALNRRKNEMPPPLQDRLPAMIKGNFLAAYAEEKTMETVLERFSSHLPVVTDWENLIAYFWANLPDFLADFDMIFPGIVALAQMEFTKRVKF